jgi:ATP-dependent RNA helicase DeaD
MEGKDVIAGAATGSGKTLAFAAGIIKLCEKNDGLQALVLTPTRELAEQVMSVIQKFSRVKNLRIIPVYGGASINPQIENLRKCEVVVGTPGRILDHLKRGTIKLGKIKILVLDEADRMLDMGFQRDVDRIIGQCNPQRQTLLFSATISRDIIHLAKRYMINPVEVSAESYVDPSKLTQVYYDVDDKKKLSTLIHFLKNETSDLIMVFCNTQRNTDFVAENLNANRVPALAIHGGHSQEKRKNTMELFCAKKCPVLVCTDVAARGLDIKGVSHVYNYDAPKDSKEYIHRIGRTARAGNEGKVINIISSRDYENFQNILNRENFKIDKEEAPETERIVISIGEPRGRGFGQNRFGGRGNGGNRYGGGSSRGGRSGGPRGFGRSSRESSGSVGRFGGRSRYGNRIEHDHSNQDDRPRGERRNRFGNRDNRSSNNSSRSNSNRRFSRGRY